MKKRNITSVVMILLGALLTLVTTVGAAKLGEGVSIGGYNGGWVLLIVFGILALVFGGTKVLTGKVKSGATIACVIIAAGGVAFLVVDIEDPEAADVTAVVDGWTITGATQTVGNITAEWDDTTDPTRVTPQINHDNNGADVNTFGTNPGFVVNFTCNPVAGSGADTTKLVTLHYKTDYDMQYDGEPVLRKTGNNYIANWSNEDHERTFYEGTMDMTLDETNWVRVFYRFDSTGNNTFGEVFATVGESMSWTITLWDDYGWTQLFTVVPVVITSDDA